MKFAIGANTQSAAQFEFQINDARIQTRQKWMQVLGIGYIDHEIYGSGCLLLYNSEPSISIKKSKWEKVPLTSCTAYLNSPAVFIKTSQDLANVILNKARFYDDSISITSAIPDSISFNPDNLKLRKRQKFDSYLKCVNPDNKETIINHLEEKMIYP